MTPGKVSSTYLPASQPACLTPGPIWLKQYGVRPGCPGRCTGQASRKKYGGRPVPPVCVLIRSVRRSILFEPIETKLDMLSPYPFGQLADRLPTVSPGKTTWRLPTETDQQACCGMSSGTYAFPACLLVWCVHTHDRRMNTVR